MYTCIHVYMYTYMLFFLFLIYIYIYTYGKCIYIYCIHIVICKPCFEDLVGILSLCNCIWVVLQPLFFQFAFHLTMDLTCQNGHGTEKDVEGQRVSYDYMVCRNDGPQVIRHLLICFSRGSPAAGARGGNSIAGALRWLCLGLIRVSMSTLLTECFLKWMNMVTWDIQMSNAKAHEFPKVNRTISWSIIMEVDPR